MFGQESQDIENRIPANNIRFNERLAQVKIVQQRRDTQGFLETNIEFLHLTREQPNQVLAPAASILRAICISIEDLLECTFESNRDCWRFQNILFKNVFLYGRVTVRNETTKQDRSFYSITIDDGTGTIDGFLNKSAQTETVKNKQSMTVKKNQLVQSETTGIRLRGEFYDSSSDECRKFITNLRNLQAMIKKNLDANEKKFSLGVLRENCLVYAFPFKSDNHEAIRLHIYDLSQCDSLELCWKRNLNRLYAEWYFK